MGDPKQRQPNITKAKVRLDWSPKVDLERGLPPTMEHFSRLLGETASAGATSNA